MFRFVEQEKASSPVSLICRVLGISPIGFYAWQRRPPSARARRDDELSVHISGIHKRSRGTYGVPLVHFELAADRGAKCSRKLVARLVRALQLEGVHRRKYVRTARRDDTLAPAPDRVRRDFNPSGPNELWVADIT